MALFESNYTPQEIKLILDFYPTKRARDIGLFLGRSADAIECKARRLGLLKNKRFSKAEDNFIRSHCFSHNAQFVADHLGRSIGSVFMRASALNCSFQKCGDDHPNTFLTSEDVEFIRTLYDEGLPIEDIADKFDASESHVKDIVHFRKRLYSNSKERNIVCNP